MCENCIYFSFYNKLTTQRPHTETLVVGAPNVCLESKNKDNNIET